MRKLLPFFVVASAVATGCAPEPPFEPVASVLELMTGVVDPAADVLWMSVATVMTEEGVEDIYPRNELEWRAVQNACYVLMESGNLLMIGERAKDDGEWMELSRDLVEVGQLALAAAQAKNPDEIFRIGGDVYAVCDACHRRYWVGEFQSDSAHQPGRP